MAVAVGVNVTVAVGVNVAVAVGVKVAVAVGVNVAVAVGVNVAVGVKNIFNTQYFTRSFDDNNKGKYVGEPRTVYVQTSVAF